MTCLCEKRSKSERKRKEQVHRYDESMNVERKCSTYTCTTITLTLFRCNVEQKIRERRVKNFVLSTYRINASHQQIYLLLDSLYWWTLVHSHRFGKRENKKSYNRNEKHMTMQVDDEICVTFTREIRNTWGECKEKEKKNILCFSWCVKLVVS